MVAEHRARQDRADDTDEDRIDALRSESRARAQRIRKRDHQRHHDRHGCPARPGRECHGGRDDECQRRKPSGIERTFQDLDEIARGLELGRGRADGPREHENDDGHHHRLQALNPCSKRFGQRQHTSDHRQEHRDNAPGERSPEKPGVGVRFADNVAEAHLVVGTECVAPGDVNAPESNHENGDDGSEPVQPARRRVGVGFVFECFGRGLGAVPVHLAFETSTALGFEHRPEVAIGCANQERQHEREQGIEPVRYRPDEHRVGVFGRADDLESLIDEADFVADPSRDERGARHRSGAGVHEKRQLLS